MAAICQAAIAAIGPHAYSDAQVAAWSARHPSADRYRARVEGGALIFVAASSDDVPVAYSLLEADGHLDHLYNHPDHTRRGLAGQVLQAAEDHAIRMGIARLYTEASELARPAFERAGYSVQHRRDFDIEHYGQSVAIHNYAMEKRLD
ncbi:GNAT family N-acetyltransferase [Parerythrobacter jejuensis]|uniref:GNAT family N-acetyltransferase n=1 Tax=Parerythrobacter jejuensis TaxID=795812 RepID=UPI001F2BA752|nr:GNAT family N-acetyltransferase [Parerythrobacter jejuensis]